ncbi:MAG: NB-ARC domain-containing protein [Albidovulum sp.]|nr:NB-ARC domain-containing protein [Albidovulum sp.]
MTISIQRLTLFAIFDALERDLRSVLLSEIFPYHYANTVLTTHEIDKVRDRYNKSKQTEDFLDDGISEYVHYLDFLDVIQILNRNKRKLTPSMAKYFSSVTPILQKSAPIRNAVMHGRPLEIDNFSTICGIAEKLSKDTDFNWSNVSDTLSEIDNDSSYVFGLNFTISDEGNSGTFHNLPIPDFDDTGFVGRKGTLTKVNDAISGPFPVISLVGPGGVGKTALALKVAYELLANQKLEFDAIVWVSAKANTLTAKEIERIEGAIEDSIGVFGSILAEFEPDSICQPEERVLELLNLFNVLLIIDNLETVLDNRLRQFIKRTPTGSKILLTSRIGVGAGDLSIEVSPLSIQDSRVYFRKLIQSYSVRLLQRAPVETVDRYIKRLGCNPLFMKWFVTAVKSGSMPERLLVDQTHILKFCLENVVEHLDSQCKQICNAYLVVDGPHSLPMLARLTELSPEEIEASLTKLMTCNIITMVSVNELGDTAYKMLELPRAYLRRIHKLPPSEASRIGERYKRIRNTIEEAGRYKGEEVYRFESFQIQTRDQAIVASDLKRAFSFIRLKQYERAEELLSSLSALAPGYFEVERVRAYLKFEQGEFASAREAYELALELRSDYAPLWYWYGGFLLRAYDNLESTLEAFDRAQELQESVVVERERARVLLYMGRFKQAEDILDKLIRGGSLSRRHSAILIDLKIQCYCRNVDHQVSIGEFHAAFELLVEARKHAEDIPSNVLDTKMTVKYKGMIRVIDVLLEKFCGTDKEAILQELKDWATNFSVKDVRRGRIGRLNTSSVITLVDVPNDFNRNEGEEYYEGQKIDGVIVRVAENGTFGFIRTSAGPELFFHQSGTVSRSQCLYMAVGVPVRATIGSNARGFYAAEVSMKFCEDLDQLSLEDRFVTAFVTSRKDGTDYGFAIIPEYGEVLIRQGDFIDSANWDTLTEGDKIQLVVSRNDKGFFGTMIRR